MPRFLKNRSDGGAPRKVAPRRGVGKIHSVRTRADKGESPDSGSAENRTPTQCAIVGIGASAGGLEAFTQLLSHLPLDTGLAFVLVQHLDPEHESALTQLLARTTSVPVLEVTHNVRVEANHVYVIPPNKSLGIAKGVLKLRPRSQTGGVHHPIDFFLEALAQDQRERAIGVILSGTASDGTLGLEAIKAEGGITFAQDDSAKYESMPRSAVAAGCVDFVLSPKEIAKELARIAKHPYVAGHAIHAEVEREANQHGGPDAALASGGHGTPPIGAVQARSEARAATDKGGEDGFKKILFLLRNHSGVDFSLYKSTTIQRRITRRMVLNKQNSPGHYAHFLKGNAKELDALYSDVLISVTSFFRNPEAFEVLQRKVFPRLLQQRGVEPLRVWVLGCSTGQEAYSIAMSFVEAAEKVPGGRKLQVFATDLNNALLDKARQGLYAKSLAQDVSPERLRRFFVEEDGGYRINKSLREMVVFARQNLISDPPFSRMDLISCRNLLIYLEPSLQQKAMPTFHYALKPEGFLFLGASESLGRFTDLFEPADKHHKIYSKKAAPARAFQLPVKKEGGRRSSPVKQLPAPLPLGRGQGEAPEGFRSELNAQREADRVMVNQFAPPGVLIDDGLQILQFRGPTGPWLEPPTGKASFDVLKMAREGLMLPLRAAINKAKKENKPVRKENVRMPQNGKARTANFEVIPLKNLRERCFLILFEDAVKVSRKATKEALAGGTTSSLPSVKTSSAERRRIAELESELSETRDYLQSILEQHEAANEELQSSNEEVQSSNEELQSINEELETSKEELESTNEELTTVNEEMANRNTELNRLNSDLINLQSSTKLPIVLLGRDLRIRRFSPNAEKQFNLVAGDLGRPFGNVRHNIEHPDLEKFIAGVISGVRERECEVRDKQGHWYSLHVRPYMTLDNKVDGAVLVLVDINAIKETGHAVTAARDFAEAIIRTARDPFLILDADLRVEKANDAFYTTFKVSPAESIGRTVFELDHGHWDIPRLRKLLQDILPRHSFFNNFEVTHDFENIGFRSMLLNARTLSETKEQPARILLGIQDVTELLYFQAEVRRSELRYRRLFEASQDGVLVIDPGTRKILDANPFMTDLLGYPREALLGQELFEIGLLKDEEASRAAFRELQKKGYIRYERLPLETRTGERREVEFVSNLYAEGAGKVIQCNIRDITERKRAEQELSEKARLLDLSNDAIIVCDLDDKITLWNKGAEKLYGWTCEEVIGKPCLSLLQTEFPKPAGEIVAQLHREGRFSGEVVQIARDGRRLPALCRWVLDRGTESILTSYTDITEREEAAEQVRLSEIRYRRLFEAARDGVLILDAVTRKITDANPFMADLLGYEREELLGREVWQVGLVRDEQASHAPFRELQQNGHIRYEAFRIQTKLGEVREVEVVADMHEEDGKHVIQCNIRDITERKQAEAAVRESEERYRTLFNSIDEGFCVIEMLFDHNGQPVDYRFLEVNPCFEQQSGLLEATGKRVSELLPELEAHWFETFGKVALTGEPVRFVNEAKALKNSWFDVYACRLGGQESRKVALLFTNITERKRSKDALRASEERYRTLFAAAPMAVFACDRDGVLLQYNRGAAELWGREPECGVERYCGSLKLWLPDGSLLPHPASPLVEVLRTGDPALNVELFIQRPDGSRLPVLVNFAALKNAQGEVTGAITSFMDISGRLEAVEALRESEKRSRELYDTAECSRISAEAAKLRAEAATRSKDDFLAALSHELRTPLNPALLLASALIEDAALPSHVRADVEVITRGIALQVQLVDDLLDLTRITGGKLRLDLQPIDAHDALRQALEMVRSEVEERQIEVTLDLSAAHHCIHADDVRVQQVFWNVLKNAVKFTPPGGTITVRTLDPAEKRDALVVEVTDTGIGIAPEMLEKIFDSFAQERHGSAHRFGGLGLGLAITRRLVELQHGQIHARSDGRDLGATFRIELPLAASGPGAADPASAPVLTAPKIPGRRILLVEDHEMTRLTLARLLERRGHTVFAAGTAARARELVTNSECDLIISDLGLPDGDGHSLMCELCAAHGLPGIALSGYGAEGDLQRSRESGFFIHLTKPVNIRALETAIAAAPPPRSAP